MRSIAFFSSIHNSFLRITMHIKHLLLLCPLLIFAACGGNNDDLTTPDTSNNTGTNNENNSGSNTDTGSTANANANPTYIPAYTRLEVPRLNRGVTDTVLVHRTADGEVNYITEWDFGKRSQRWSCYVINSSTLQQNTTRYYSDDNQYPDDPLIPTSMQWATDPYYRNSYKLDHGHICPSADRLNSREANIQTFYMTNMQPQYNAFNAGIWAKLEAKVRTIGATNVSDTLYVCKGGTIDGGKYGNYNKVYMTLDNGLLVPRYFYMAMLRLKNGRYSAIAFWIDQVSNATDTGANMKQYAITIDELEERTGIDFFCNLPDNIETEVEQSYGALVGWGL